MAGSLRKTILRVLKQRAVELLVVCLLLVAAIYGWIEVRKWQTQLLELQSRVDQAPQEVANKAMAEGQLKEYQGKTDQILNLAVQPSGVGAVVAYLELIARQKGVSVNVPTIQEVQVYDDAGMPIPWNGPYKEVRLLVSASGSPNNLIQYLHAIEYAPYFLRVSEWSIKTTQMGVTGFAVPAITTTSSSKSPEAWLDAQIILTIQNNGI